MKLEPKAKPVRIRIKSGGEEHSTLESLKMNFSVDDLKPAVEDRRLSRWLKQQGQNELAEGVLRYQGKMKSLSGNDYLGFIKLFFANEPDIEKVKDDCSLAGFFHGKWEKNFDRVFERCCEKQSFAAIHYFYKTYKDKKNTDSWIELFESLKDGLEPKNMANCLAELAILYGERNMPIKKIRSLCSAIAIGSKDAERELQNMTQSKLGMGANALNSPNDWLNLLEKFEKKVGHSEKCEFLRDLSTAYKSSGDLIRAKQFLTEAAQMGDKESAELLLEGADFRTVKTLYETPGSKGLFSPQEWLDVFESIEGMVDEADKIEYYVSLYKQYLQLGKKELAEKFRQECFARVGKPLSIGIRNDVVPENSLHPAFSLMLNNDIIKYDIDCLSILWMHLKENNDPFLDLMRNYIFILIKCAKKRGKTDKKGLDGWFEFVVDSKGLHPSLSYYDLHEFLYGLCYEYVFEGTKMGYRGNYQLSYYRLLVGTKITVSSNHGFSCVFPSKLNEESFIQMALFAMETSGDNYSYEKLP